MITKLFLLLASGALLYQGTRNSAHSLALVDRMWGKLLDLKNFE